MPGIAYTELIYERRGDVGVITLNRPDARNALTHTTYAELEDAVRTSADRCLVITGADPAFCSGDDVKQVMAAAGDRVAEGLRSEPRLTPAAGALLGTDIPIIAAINGAAVGWGMELALMADIRIASDRAKLGELFVKRGLVLRRPRDWPPRTACRSRDRGRVALYRPDHRRGFSSRHRACVARCRA